MLSGMFGENRKKMATPQLNEWFDVCFANGNIIIPIEDYSRKIYDKSLG